MERDLKAQKTRNAILDAAIELFMREGFEKTSMDAIALAAEVAKGTLYYHYDSKEGIVDAVVERYAKTMEARLAAVEADRRLGFAVKLAAFAVALKQVNSTTFSKLHHVRYIDIHDKTLAVMVERGAPHFARILEQGNQAGDCRVADPLGCAELLLAAGHALLDPEAGREQLPRRLAAISQMTASALGMDPRVIERAYRPLTETKRRHAKKPK
jgi:AcrR family transcriptional regulator